jgi:transposase
MTEGRGSRAKLDEIGEEEVFSVFAAGKTVAQVGEHFGVGRDTLYRWVQEGGPAREAALKAARSQAAEVVFEDAGQIADDIPADATSAQVQKAKLRMEHRYKLAAVYDPERFGDRPAVTINNHLSVGELHLNALRRVGNMAQAPKQISGPVVDAEVVEDTDSEV